MASQPHGSNVPATPPIVNNTKLLQRATGALRQVKRITAGLGGVVASGAVRGFGLDEDIEAYASQLEALEAHMGPIREILLEADGVYSPAIQEKLKHVKATLGQYDLFRKEHPSTNLGSLQKQKETMKKLLTSLSAGLEAFRFKEDLEAAAVREASQADARSSSTPAVLPSQAQTTGRQTASVGQSSNPAYPVRTPDPSQRDDDFDEIQARHGEDIDELILQMNGLAGFISTAQPGRHPHTQPVPVVRTTKGQHGAMGFGDPLRPTQDSHARQARPKTPPYSPRRAQTGLIPLSSEPEEYPSDEDYDDDDYSTPPVIMPAPQHQQYPHGTRPHLDVHSAPPFATKSRHDGRGVYDERSSPPLPFPEAQIHRTSTSSRPARPSITTSPNNRHQQELPNPFGYPDDAMRSPWTRVQQGVQATRHFRTAGRRRVQDQEDLDSDSEDADGVEDADGDDDDSNYPGSQRQEGRESPTARRRRRLTQQAQTSPRPVDEHRAGPSQRKADYHKQW